MPRPLPLALAILVVLLAGVAQGLWTDRWAVSHELEAACSKVALVPTTLGDWEGHDLELRQVRRERYAEAGIAAMVNRRYRNRRTGREVDLLLVCGRPGPIATHSPLTCMP